MFAEIKLLHDDLWLIEILDLLVYIVSENFWKLEKVSLLGEDYAYNNLWVMILAYLCGPFRDAVPNDTKFLFEIFF